MSSPWFLNALSLIKEKDNTAPNRPNQQELLSAFNGLQGVALKFQGTDGGWRMYLDGQRDECNAMGVLRCKSPAMVHKEILMHFIAHNLVRLLMQEAALVWSVPLERVSFKGALDIFREYLTAVGSRR